MLVSVGLGILVVFGLSFSADAPKLLGVLSTFQWNFLPFILALTLVNYVLRFVKWNFYLRVVGIRDVPMRQSAVIFTAGLAMAITPGKVGELLKAYLLRYFRGTPIATGAPIVVAERMTDGVAMVLLATGGLLLYGNGWELIIPILAGMTFVVVISQNRGLVRWALGIADRIPFVSSKLHHFEAAMESAYQLFRVRNLLIAVGLGIISWGSETVAFYLVLTALGLPASFVLAVQAAFILATSSLVGAASMLPGGLAAAEGSLAGLLLILGVTHDPSVAAAATLIIRFATLWFGVAIGLIGLALAASQLHGAELSDVGAATERQTDFSPGRSP
jgi:uncharacterized protein (TIRG00374 family)